MQNSKSIFLESPESTETMGATVAKSIHAPAVIFLEGQLGAGKTTFVRGFLRGLGFQAHVKSPTFTLVETYDENDHHIVHADLYRLKNTDELDAIGFRDYFSNNTICIIEWASQAYDWLPKPDMVCTLQMKNEGRVLEIKRK